MVKRVIFYLEEERYKRCLAEAAEAVQSFKQYGFDADLWVIEAGEEIPEPDHNTLYLADSKRLLQMLADRGAVYCAYSHEANKGEELKPADYVLSEPQWVDRDSLVKIWQRGRHLPWTILETERCLVREFVPGDLEAICQLYDDEARKYLEAPSQDLEKERKILAAYIDRGCHLCGYGHWAVLDRGSGKLIGRMGFSFPKASAPGPAVDATFGYLLHRDWRGRGIAREVCAALLDYGFTQLGFSIIGADAEASNEASAKILKSFGFTEVAREGEQRYYTLHMERTGAAARRSEP